MRLREALDGRRIFLTGVTGFVGQAFLARVLSDLPGTRLVVLVRPKGSQTGRDRVEQLLRRPAFRELRASGVDLDDLLDERVQVIDGDLAQPPPLPAGLDVVIHCAGDVSFDPAIDDAFVTNVLGTRQLLDRVVESAAGGPLPHYVHISTCYVAGRRRGAIPETSVEHSVDWQVEADSASRVHQRLEDSSRLPAVLAPLAKAAEKVHGRAGPLTAAADTERRRREWVDDQLIHAGRDRARSLGWTDCYTFTKALGERVVEHYAATAGLPASILRPSIIESAVRDPAPGWIEGFKMAEPIILAYGRGDLPEFPSPPDSIVDFVPVDLIVSSMVAVAASAVVGAPLGTAVPPAASSEARVPTPVRYFHVGSSWRNPVTFSRIYELMREYFDAHPLPVGDRGAPRLPVWTFPGSDAVERLLVGGEKAFSVADAVLTRAPRSDTVRRLAEDLDRQQRRLDFLRRYLDLYKAYTEADLQFIDDATLALHRGMDPADREQFPFDTAAVDWTWYIRDSHCPAITRQVRDAAALRSRRGPRAGAAGLSADLPADPRVLAAFDMDGTLLSSNVVEGYLWLRLPELSGQDRAREIGALARKLPSYLRAERRDRGGFLRAVYRRYAGADPVRLDAIVDELIAEHLLARTSADALRRIRQHRAAGHRTVLITGAIRQLTRPIAPLFDEVVAADLAIGPDGRCTGYLASPPLVGESRAAWLRRYAAVEGLDLTRSWAYADSHSDAPMLAAVGNPVAVSADVSLARTARRGRWASVTWRSGGARARWAVPGGSRPIEAEPRRRPSAVPGGGR